MRNTCSDETMNPEERYKLLRKKVVRDLRKWEKDISTGSIRRLRKLRRLMADVGMDETPWATRIEELRKTFIIEGVMNS